MQPTWEELQMLLENRVEEFVELYKEELDEMLEEIDSDGDTPEDFFDVLFSYIFGVVVDWREEEPAIAEGFSEAMDDEDYLVAEYSDDTDPKLPLRLFVDYNGAKHTITLTGSHADRYIAIRAYRDIFSDKYDIKLYRESYASDTHVFQLLPKVMWEMAEAEYPDVVKTIFMDITKNLDFP